MASNWHQGAKARTSGPTLDQRLRFIDLTIECVRRAENIHHRVYGWSAKPFMNEIPSPRGKRIGEIAARLRAKACEREGLPIEALLGPVRFSIALSASDREAA